MQPTLTLEQITEDLNLIHWEQDWGICNSDAKRLAEFTDYYRRASRNFSLGWLEERELGDLLLESANDVVQADK